ncbi:hypothetical protein TraAM80_09282 [Trypanosoma rangeli]|uniref:Uncharacterized protein n=1 Tax=Trypanosoma rangeli TaxID=5698 RepID=A0A422MWL0_TRYRA|nr:uncharacterized protein TraAM80_09282 [Trypanosoma rangeli]RNE97590.1 hypothetical protein TraAM80_09282 [Trypanosoma rangeli]|eukprot:RNE97590.1 hypothetical protein TraAM80_09282 [Trypanosoma rangeli]
MNMLGPPLCKPSSRHSKCGSSIGRPSSRKNTDNASRGHVASKCPTSRAYASRLHLQGGRIQAAFAQRKTVPDCSWHSAQVQRLPTCEEEGKTLSREGVIYKVCWDSSHFCNGQKVMAVLLCLPVPAPRFQANEFLQRTFGGSDTTDGGNETKPC